MKNRITAMILAVIAGAAMMMSFTGCDGDSSTGGTSSSKSTKKDNGGYDQEYWDAAKDAWDANT